MRLDFEISNLAQNDLENIWINTFRKWSLDQANKYYKIIMDEINLICENPDIGRGIPEIKKQHRIHQIKSHLIVYKIDSNKIWVDRILQTSTGIESVFK